jgi:hypothetical protein
MSFVTVQQIYETLKTRQRVRTARAFSIHYLSMSAHYYPTIKNSGGDISLLAARNLWQNCLASNDHDMAALAYGIMLTVVPETHGRPAPTQVTV